MHFLSAFDNLSVIMAGSNMDRVMQSAIVLENLQKTEYNIKKIKGDKPISSEYGQTDLPESNAVPASISIKKFDLPYTQIGSRDLISNNPFNVILPASMTTKVTMKKVQSRVLVVPVLRTSQDLEFDDMKTLLAAALYPLFKTRVAQTDLVSYDIYQGIVAVLATLDINLTSLAVTASLKQIDLSIQYLEVNTIGQFVAALDKSDKNVSFTSVLSFFNANDVMNDNNIYPILGVCLLVLGKQLNEANYNNWYDNRMKAACAICPDANPEILKPVSPELDSMVAAHKAFSSVFEFRKLVFLKLHAMSNEEGLLGQMLKQVMQLLSFTEMTYIVTIDHYIMTMMPELMGSVLLRPYEQILINMMHFLNKHKNYVQYIKFLVPPEECNPINRAVLRNLICAATAIAKKTVESFKNYKGGDQGSTLFDDLTALIDKYLEIRKAAAVSGMLDNKRAAISQAEKALGFTLALDGLQDIDTKQVPMLIDLEKMTAP